MQPERAVEVFVHGFRFTRSYSHLYKPVRYGNAWLMRDDPPRDEPRIEELAIIFGWLRGIVMGIRLGSGTVTSSQSLPARVFATLMADEWPRAPLT